MIECAADMIEELLPQLEPALRARVTAGEPAAAAVPELGPDEQRLYGVLSHEAQSVDAVIERTGLSAAQVSATMLSLELRGMVRQLPGPQYLRR